MSSTTVEDQPDVDDEAPRRSSFWTSLPGILTGLAAIGTALATLLGVLIVRDNSGPTPPVTTIDGTTQTTADPLSTTTPSITSPTTSPTTSTSTTTSVPQAALPGYEVVRRDLAVAAGAVLRDTATCPAGKVVLGGGAQVVGEGSRDFRTTVQESAPGTIDGGNRSLWSVSLRNGDGTAHTVGIFAVCATAPPGYDVGRRDAVVAPGALLRQTTNCPPGTVVFGGGAAVVGAGTGDFKTTVQQSAPGTLGGSQSLWGAHVRNGGTVSRTVAVFAVCARTVPGYEVVRKDVPVNAGAVLLDTATCPNGKVVLGGGASVVGEGTADFKTVLQSSTPGTVGGGAQALWSLSFRNGDTRSHTAGLFAVCAAGQR